jgi:HK97 family phage major capsid protein
MDEKELKALLQGVAEKNGEAIKLAVKTEVEAATAGLMNSAELATKLEAMGLKDGAIKELIDAVEKQGIELNKMLNGSTGTKKGLEEIIAEKTEAIKSIGKNGPSVKISIPTANKTLVQRSAVSGTTMAMRLAEIGQLPYASSVISDLFRHVQVSPSSNGILRYYDQLAVTRNAAFVAEGGTKPESAITWIERNLVIEKIADSIPVTKEAWADVGFIQGEIRRLLEINLALKEDEALYDGSGVTPIIKGVFTSAPAFVTTPYDDSVESANLFDLILAMATDISASRQSKYKADTVLLNPVNTLGLKLLKDSEGRYLAPSWANGENIGGLRVVESNQVDANTMVVGDFRFGTVYDLEDTTIEMGWINDQFIKNTFTILAEKRLALLIRTVDETAFRKVTNITTALAALETP